MQMQHVENSSSVVAHGYDASARRMRLTFKSGGSYDYEDVPPEVYAELAGAKSIGAHFHAHIKPTYRASKVAA